MKLNKNTVKELNVGDSIFYDGKECLVKGIYRSKIAPERWTFHVERIEDGIDGHLELSDVEGSEIIQGKSWKTRMECLIGEVKAMQKQIDSDMGKWFVTEDDNEMDDFRISYRGQEIKIPIYVSLLFDAAYNMLEDVIEGAEEQL